MFNTPNNILKELHFLRFRKPGFKRNMVLSHSAERQFTQFLIDALGRDVFVISTALGLDVYYSNQNRKTDFIVKNLWLFQEKEEQDRAVLIEEYDDKEVLNYFNRSVESLSKHPQLFLSTCKKFMHQYNTYFVKSRLLILLYSIFESHLQGLITDSKLPYVQKIKKLLDEVYDPTQENPEVLNMLTKNYLKDKSHN